MTANQAGKSLPSVYIHIGEPKTGTTFLQQLMFANKDLLTKQGVVLPGGRPRHHFRATQDLRGVVPAPDDPLAPFDGAWDELAEEVRAADRVGIVSHELLAAATAEQADRALGSFDGHDVHVVITVRDFASLLPAEWQETVKNRNVRSYEDWLADVIDRESVDPDRRRWGFWNVHDTLAILQTWSRNLPPERVHVITVPPRGSSRTLLWERFAGLIGVDPASVDVSVAKSNASLSVAEVEFIRRVNEVVPPDMPDWFYMHFVKGALAHTAFDGRPATRQRLGLPADRDEWVDKQADLVIADLRAHGFDVIGDLDELRPHPRDGERPLPGNVDLAEVVDASVVAAGALLAALQDSTFDLMAADPDRPQWWWMGVRPPQGRIRRYLVTLSLKNERVLALRKVWWRVANAARAVDPRRLFRGPAK